MKRGRYYFFLFLVVLLPQRNVLSQEIDTLNIIKDIREKFSLIYNQQIEGMQVCYYTPDENIAVDEEEHVSGAAHNFTFYYSDSNIYMIREYNMSDEGGPMTYSSSMEETYFFQNEPFFYYRKDFGGDFNSDVSESPVYILYETRKYIYKGEIIRILSKNTRKNGIWLFEESQLIDVKTDSVPSIKQAINKQHNKFYWNSENIERYLEIISKENQKANNNS
ncbi:MAG: hypothetical protein JXA77_01885 [Bacteroidales bacterium]|nr:hypothetical protein [Bacteroidales bacterium]MBN2820840.1 hypothetical protein [Bacteroidales bacterium]